MREWITPVRRSGPIIIFTEDDILNVMKKSLPIHIFDNVVVHFHSVYGREMLNQFF